jgi:transposase
VIESTTNAWHVYDLLAPLVAVVKVANPIRIKQITEARTKTDKRDAMVLARLLAANMIPEVWVPPVHVRELRQLISQRQRLVEIRTKVVNRMHSVSHRHHLSHPKGKLFGDRGYLSQALFEQLLRDHNLVLITKLRRNMKNRLMDMIDKILLRRWAAIECIINQLKNISQIEHSRHRSPTNFFVNVLVGLIAYCHRPKKPSLKFADLHASALLIHN